MANARTDLESFAAHLQSAKRIAALCGAGLSAASGLPTFRGAGGYWRKYEATSLATPRAFKRNPDLVWQFYNYRRHMALKAKPNKAHYALAALARTDKEFLCITQNVDGLSQRAEHSRESLVLLHGTLFDLKCSMENCGHVDPNNFNDPPVPALHINEDQGDLANIDIPLNKIEPSELPQCPRCQRLLRPGVVWFGESLPSNELRKVDRFMDDPQGVDLIIVIGTAAAVYPAAGYIQIARDNGARVAVVNIEAPGTSSGRLRDDDWFFQGDAATLIPQMLESVIGTLPSNVENL